MDLDTPRRLRAIVHELIDALAAGNAARIVALYAHDATVEDPVGTEPVCGRAAIAEFYARAVALGVRIELVSPVRGSHGLAAAMAFDVVADRPDGQMRIAVIEVLEFDPALKIKSMRAYWAPDDAAIGTTIVDRRFAER